MITNNFINRMISISRNNKGFTLVELMVVLFLVVLIIFMAYNMLFASGNLLQENRDRADAQNQARKIFQFMQKEVGTAEVVKIIATANPTSITFPDSSYIAFYSDGSNFYQMGSTKNPVSAFGTENIKELNVTYSYIDSKTLTINIIGSNDFSMESTVYSRNVSIGRDPATLTTGNILFIKSAI